MTTLELPDLPDLSNAGDHDIRYWLGHARAQHKAKGDMPRGVTRAVGGYSARIQMARVMYRLGVYPELAQAAHVAAVAQQRWLDHLVAHSATRSTTRTMMPLPDVRKLDDEDLLLAAKQIRNGNSMVAQYRGGPRVKVTITCGSKLRVYLGIAESAEEAQAMVKTAHDELDVAVRAELRRRLVQLRAVRAARETKELKEDPYAE